MKKLCLIIFIFSPFLLRGDDDILLNGDVANESIESPLSPSSSHQGPFRVEISADTISKVRLSNHQIHQSLAFTEMEANATVAVYYDPQPVEVVYLTCGYQWQDLEWRGNPFFHQTNFNNLSLAIGGISSRFEKWMWRMQGTATINLDHLNFNKYLYGDFLLWGRCQYTAAWNLHVGFYTWLGMRMNRIIPIIGFDWRMNSQWRLNAVFPVNLSLVYTFRKGWTIALAARVFSSRNRLGSHEKLSQGLYEYRSVGAEINLRYKNKDCIPIEAHFHAGYNFGGQIKVFNQNHRHRRSFNLGVAPYIGGEISCRF